jgi:hypothetical protein
VQGVRGTGPQSRLPRTGTMRITTRTRGVTRKWGLVAGVRGSRRPGQGSPRTANAILLPAAWGDHPWGRNHPHPGGQGRCRRSAVPERDRLDLERDRPILERIGISPQDVLGGLSDTYGVRSGPGGGDFQVAPPNRGSLRTPRDARSRDRAHSPCPLRGTETARGWSPPHPTPQGAAATTPVQHREPCRRPFSARHADSDIQRSRRVAARNEAASTREVGTRSSPRPSGIRVPLHPSSDANPTQGAAETAS